MKLEYLSATEIGALVNQKIIRPMEVVKYFEKRIEERNKDVNAFVYTKFEYAEEQANNLEHKIMQGEVIGPFAGVPFALKDFLPNKIGWQSSHGGVECLISTDTVNSVFCEAIEKAGGIAIGKTNAPAYGFRGTTDNKLYGPTCNPFNIKYNSGGSSGGSAVAVAAGLVPIAEGGDAGGSIRIPASWCNLFGFKPSVGIIPSVCRPDAWSATHPFCFNFGLTKTVKDACILLRQMAKFDSRDPFSLPTDLYQFKPNVHKIKIAVTYDFNLFEIDSKIRDFIDISVKNLEDLNCEVDFITFNFKHSAEDFGKLWCQALMFDSVIELEQAKQLGHDYIKDYPEQFPEEIVYWKNLCESSNIWDLYKFNLVRTDLLDQFENIFDKYDYILSPTSCCMPVLNASDRNTKGPSHINGKEVNPLIGWSQTHLINFIGYPAASIPIGVDSDTNLPYGVQLVGKKFSDFSLLQFCNIIEHVYPWSGYYKLVHIS